MLACYSLPFVLAAGCGTTSSAEPSPTVSGFNGTLTAETLTFDGMTVQVDGVFQFIVDTDNQALRVSGPCGDQIGSYSILENGQASFTLLGERPEGCSSQRVTDTALLLRVVESINSWSGQDSRIVLSGTNSKLSLLRS